MTSDARSDHLMHDNSKSVAMANLWVAFAAFFVAIILGVYQVANRSGLFPEIESHALYFASVSTHGVLMGFVLTTFFIMGFGYYTVTSTLKRPLWNRGLAWIGFYVALGGTVIAAVPLLTGQASVLYTFYPPLKAHPAFYIGATLLVVGSWIWCLEMIVSTVKWKRDNPGEIVPLAMYGTTANAIMWLWTSAGVAIEMLFQLIPWSLGLISTIDPGLARTLFSWTLHAIVYFWLFPAYIAMYTILPKLAGGRLFSDEMARIAFILDKILHRFGLTDGTVSVFLSYTLPGIVDRLGSGFLTQRLDITGLVFDVRYVDVDQLQTDLFEFGFHIAGDIGQELIPVAVDLLNIHRGHHKPQLTKDNVLRQIIDLLLAQTQQSLSGIIHNTGLCRDPYRKSGGHIYPDILPTEGISQVYLNGDRSEIHKLVILDDRPDKCRATVDTFSGSYSVGTAANLTKNHQNTIGWTALIALKE